MFVLLSANTSIGKIFSTHLCVVIIILSTLRFCESRIHMSRRTSLPGRGAPFSAHHMLGGGSDPPQRLHHMLGGGSRPPQHLHHMLGGGSRPPQRHVVSEGGGAPSHDLVEFVRTHS